MQTQRIQIDTQPAGATVWMENETGQHQAGPAPTELEIEFDAEVGVYHSIQVIPPIVSLVATIVGIVALSTLDDIGDEDQFFLGSASLVGGITGLLFSVPSYARSKKQQDQILKVHYRDIKIGARAKGYLPTSVNLRIPHQQTTLNLRLHPRPPSETESPDQDRPKTSLPPPGDQNESQQD